MSFSFQNIFSPDEGGSEEKRPWEAHSGRSDRNESASSSQSGEEELRYQAFLASELLAFIPPAIAAPSGIPMEKEIHVPFQVGSGQDVRLSTLYQMCPELFGAEITPLNDSTVTLPARLLAPGASNTPARAKTLDERLQERRGASNGVNPFWCPVSSGKASGEEEERNDMKAEPSSEGPEERSKRPDGPAGGANPFAGHSPSKSNAFSAPASIPEKGKASDLPKPAGGFDGPEFNVAGTAGCPPVNPFENQHGFSTLFSKAAAADTEIPMPEPSQPAKAEKDDRGVWGSMFQNPSSSTSPAPDI